MILLAGQAKDRRDDTVLSENISPGSTVGWPLQIMCIASYPCNVCLMVGNDLHSHLSFPCRLTPLWSCSTILFITCMTGECTSRKGTLLVQKAQAGGYTACLLMVMTRRVGACVSGVDSIARPVLEHSVGPSETRSCACRRQSPGESCMAAVARAIPYSLIRLGFDFGVRLGYGFQNSVRAVRRDETLEEHADIVEERVGHRRD